MFKIWCEWDVNQEGLVFTSVKAARNWLAKNEALEECFEPGLQGDEAVEDLISGGLVTIELVTVINEEGESV